MCAWSRSNVRLGPHMAGACAWSCSFERQTACSEASLRARTPVWHPSAGAARGRSVRLEWLKMCAWSRTWPGCAPGVAQMSAWDRTWPGCAPGVAQMSAWSRTRPDVRLELLKCAPGAAHGRMCAWSCSNVRLGPHMAWVCAWSCSNERLEPHKAGCAPGVAQMCTWSRT